MKIFVRRSAVLALIGFILSPLAVAHASSPPADSVHFCQLIDYEQWRRDHPRPAGKRLALNVGEPRTVRLIYFLPNDRPFRQEVVDSMKVTIRRVQTFYAEQMQAHGYGNRDLPLSKQMSRVSRWCIASMGNTPIGTMSMTGGYGNYVHEEIEQRCSILSANFLTSS